MAIRTTCCIAAWILAFCAVDAATAEPAAGGYAEPAAGGYAVVVSKATAAADGWKEVVQTLRTKHGGTVVTYDTDPADVLPELTRLFPRHTCFVATPQEAGRKFVASVHRLARKLDDDPYTDTLWGIVTGYDAECAMRIAKETEPLVIERVASGTELAMEMVVQGVWYCELNKNLMVRKEPGGEAKRLAGPDDTTKALVDALNDYKAQLFVTSGHATERDWQIGFRYRNGQFRCKDGQLFGRDTQGAVHNVDSPSPKVFMPIGNCLMGHVDGPDAMALAYMNTGGVRQMLGYTVPTWFGYGGWGCLDYFVEQPGRYTFTEAFFANHLALLHRIETEPAGPSTRGLTFDRDNVAFYGDPAWQARMAPMPCAWDQTLTETDGTYTLTIEPNRGAKTFEPININGSQRGGRPIIAFLPQRVKDVKIVTGADLKPVVADDFILVPNPKTCDPSRKYEVVFTATPIR